MITGDKFIVFTGKNHNNKDVFSDATVLFNETEKIRKISLYEHLYEYTNTEFSDEIEIVLYELEIQTLIIVSHFQYPTKSERDADYKRFLKIFKFEVKE